MSAAAPWYRPVGREVPAAEVGGAVVGGFEDDTALFDRLVVALLGGVGVGLDAEATKSGGELAGGEGGGVVDHQRDHPAGRRFVEVGGAVGDDPGAGQVDRPVAEGRPHPGEAAAASQARSGSSGNSTVSMWSATDAMAAYTWAWRWEACRCRARSTMTRSWGETRSTSIEARKPPRAGPGDI